jgi:hypothetical protein
LTSRRIFRSEFREVDFYATVSNCVVVGGVFYFVGDATVVDEPLDIAKVVAVAVGTCDSVQKLVLTLERSRWGEKIYLTTFPSSFLARQMLPAEWFREAALTAALRCGREEEEESG